MIAKGLDFDKVTLVGVIQGDASLALPDFRSAERTFDLLSQVAGRSGRGKQSGEVIIQGFNIDHYSIIAASNHDYQKFYSMEMNLRKSLQYPPYCNLCLIKLSGRDYKEVYNEALKVSNYLYKNTKNITILGPSVANTLKLNNKYYLQIILKYKDTKLLRPSLEFIKKNFNLKTKIILDIDFNPKKI
jgi:primosomal protein N' (replication factor Y)